MDTVNNNASSRRISSHEPSRIHVGNPACRQWWASSLRIGSDEPPSRTVQVYADMPREWDLV